MINPNIKEVLFNLNIFGINIANIIVEKKKIILKKLKKLYLKVKEVIGINNIKMLKKECILVLNVKEKELLLKKFK